MGSQFSKRAEERAPVADLEGKTRVSVELISSYEDACKMDVELRNFDDALQARTERAINALANGIEVHSLSFESLREVTTCLLEMDQEVVKVILDCKKDIWNNPDLFELAEEYFENSLQTLDFCGELENCLRHARGNQLIIQVALQQIPAGGEEEEEEDAQYGKIMEELNHFKTAGSPFTEEFFEHFQNVQNRHVQMLIRLQARKKKLDRKLKSVKAWKKLSNIIFAVSFAALLICSVVAAAMAAPHIAAVLAAATAIPLPSMGRWVNSLWKKYEDALTCQREVMVAMRAGTVVAIRDLENIRVLVNRLENDLGSILRNIDFCSRDRAAVLLGIEEIRRKNEIFMKNIEDLGEHVDRCSRDIRQARTVVLQRIIKPPKNRSASG